MKLSLELTEKQMKGMIPQADKPKDTVGKAPWTKGTKFSPKPPKVKSSGFKQPEYKASTKFAKKGTPLKTGSVTPGSADKLQGKSVASSSAKEHPLKQPVYSKQKSVSKPPAPKVAKSKAAVPDAMDVTSRGLGKANASEPGLAFKKKVSKAVEPSKSSKNITIGNAKIVKPDLGWSVLKPGKVMDKLGNLSIDMKSVAKPPAPKSYPGKSPIPSKPVTESVFEGSVEIHVAGRLKAVFEAATPEVVARKARDYAEIGARVHIEPVYRGRTLYADKEFSALMIEAEHARHHGLPIEALRKRAFRRAEDFLSAERDPRVHNRDRWLRECLLPTVRQAEREFRSAYKSELQAFDVTVVTEGKRFSKPVLAADEQHAAAMAIDAVLSEDIEAAVRGVFVGGKKFLSESGGKSMFMRFPKPFAELKGAVFNTKKTRDGDASEPNVKKPPTIKIGKSSSPKGVGSLKIKDNTSFDKGGEKSSLVDKTGSKSKLGKVLSMSDKPKDSGPIYERRRVIEDASQRVLALIALAAKKASGDKKRAFEELAEKVKADEDLTQGEELALDKFIGIALKRG